MSKKPNGWICLHCGAVYSSKRALRTHHCKNGTQIFFDQKKLGEN